MKKLFLSNSTMDRLDKTKHREHQPSAQHILNTCRGRYWPARSFQKREEPWSVREPGQLAAKRGLLSLSPSPPGQGLAALTSIHNKHTRTAVSRRSGSAGLKDSGTEGPGAVCGNHAGSSPEGSPVGNGLQEVAGNPGARPGDPEGRQPRRSLTRRHGSA